MSAASFFARQIRFLGRSYLTWQRGEAARRGISFARRKNRGAALTLFAGALCAVTLSAVAMMPSFRETTFETRTVEEILPAPDLSARIDSLRSDPNVSTEGLFVRNGDTLTSLFARLGIEDDEAFAWIRRTPKARPVVNPQPGQFVSAGRLPDGRLSHLRLYMEGPHEADERTIEVSRYGESLSVTVHPFTFHTEETYASARAGRNFLQTTRALGLSSGEVRRATLLDMAEALCSPARQQAILEANAADLEAARGHISEVMLDRLALTPERINAMAKGIREVADLPDPVGRVLRRVERPNGLVIEKTAVPMGVIAIIYESRPNVTSDAAALAIKSGNACILRCGREAWRSANAIVAALREGLQANDLPETAVCLIEDTTHASANTLMTAVGYVDLLIPRGGAGLIRACVENAKVPCIQTGTGICHIFVDASAEQDKALDIIENAKASRPSVCNAEEVCLVHRDIAAEFLPKLARRLGPDRAAKGLHPVELRLDPRAAAIIPGTPAGPADFDTEFLDYILAVKVVDSVEEAVSHIAAHSTGHSEAILTRNEAHAALFTAAVDSAAVYVNCSTRFTDGGEFGLGCEMGISTQKLHARGPMGLEELCSYKYIIHGSGQIR